MQSDPQPVFRALADPTRRAILEMLVQQPRSVGAIAEGFDVSRPAVAKHLTILREGGLIVVHHKGRERINVLCPEALEAVTSWMTHFDQFWDEKLLKLKHAVEKNQ